MKVWYLYILECNDGSLYTGITTDYKKRIEAHNDGKGAKYTKGRGPVQLRFLEMHASKSAALKREIAIKKYSKKEKIKHINYWSENRFSLFEVLEVLTEQNWKNEGAVDVPSNDSVYALWVKNNRTLYVGNYYLQGDIWGVYGWADRGETKENIIEFLTKLENRNERIN